MQSGVARKFDPMRCTAQMMEITSGPRMDVTHADNEEDVHICMGTKTYSMQKGMRPSYIYVTCGEQVNCGSW